MATVVAFSGASGDNVLVEEAADTVASKLMGTGGMVQLTRIPGAHEQFEPMPVWVTVARVAYVSASTRQWR
jgi:hypothetical protein